MFEKIVQDYLNHGDSVISNKLNNEHRPENQRPQQKTKWQSPETKIIHPAITVSDFNCSKSIGFPCKCIC